MVPSMQTEELTMRNIIKNFIANESGATAIEYGLIAAIVSVGLIAALSTLKSNLQDTYNTIGTAVKNAN
jgi:pilus assembly protein Flp/PilA